MRINQKLQDEIRAHAERAYPGEACGLLVKTATGRQLRIPREAGYDGELFEVGAQG